jgi:hypothetical protein
VSAGSLVEFRDQVAGLGEHHRVQSMLAVGSPCIKHILGECGQVADVDASPVEVETERLRPAVA